jgi:hypothetical protein
MEPTACASLNKKEKQREYLKQWRAKNADKERIRQREVKRKWRAEHEDVNVARAKKWREQNRALHRLQNYKNRADTGKRSWHLTKEMAMMLFHDRCYYCKDERTLNGIDRKDNNIGYYLTNVVTCCQICNTAKGQMSEEQFKEWAQRLSKHYLGQ